MKTHYDRLRKRTYLILNPNIKTGLFEKCIDIFILSLIFLNVIAIIIESSIKDQNFLNFLKYFELVSVIVFSIEYILRIWSSDFYNPTISKWKARFKYMFTAMAIIDLAAILPFYLPFVVKIDLRALRTLRLFRLLRLFKTNRYTKSMTKVAGVLKAKSSELLSSISFVLILMVISAALMYNVESIAQPEAFGTMFDSFWWAIATLTTVGYGDVFPITAAGKIISGIIAVLGIGIVAIPTGIIASGFSEAMDTKEDNFSKNDAENTNITEE